MIDWQRVEDLRGEVGADDFMEVVELFLEEVDEVIGRLAAAPDPAAYEQDLHFLKGSALNLGFSSLAMLCNEGERLAASGALEKVDIAGVIGGYTASKSEFLARLKMLVAA